MTPASFAKSYKELNKGQKEAVDTVEGPVMVIAGPGTGKTTVLTLRIANILDKTDTPPNGILAITYTDAGVKAMRQKLHSFIGSRSHEVEIHTFHSFASMCIAEYADHFIHLQGLKQMTDVEQEMLVKGILEEPKFKDLRPTGKPDAYMSAVLRSIDSSKRDALTPKDVRDFANSEIKRIKSDESSISTRGKTKGKLKADAEEKIERCKRTLVFANVYEKYEEEKLNSKRIDFNDLILELLKALKEDELFLRLIQERFLYIMVDEHQDTNDAQNLIVSLIAEFFDTPNLFIVGDEKQAIYRFQGASVENFLKLRLKWPAMKLISLDTNYRSHQTILDAGFAMIENNYEDGESEDLRIELKSSSLDKPRPIDLVLGENVSATETYLVNNLKDLIKTKSDATVAVITRRNRDLERVIRLLESNQIPVSSERSVDIFHHPVGTTFFDLIQFLIEPSRLDCLSRTITAGLWNISFDKSVTLFRDLRAGKTEGLEEMIPALKSLQNKLLEDLGVGFIVEAGEESGFTELVSRDPSYIHVWRAIVALAESLARDANLYNPEKIISSMLAYRESAESKPVKVSVGAPDLPIRAMTAHGSKGLEFDYVYIAHATDESWVGKNRGSSFVLPLKKASDSDIRDVRRLFYVALTRARKHVTILTAEEESDGKKLSKLRFIDELDPKTLSIISLSRKDIQTPETRLIERKSENKIIGLAKEVLLGSGISVTALNHFIECPNKYIYESILKMPQAPSVSASKGTAMHDAIAKVWANGGGETEEISKVMLEEAENSMKESLISPKNKNAVIDILKKDIPLVAEALEGHFNQKGTKHIERWFKANFGHVFKGEHLTIPLHGRLDAVIESEGLLKVFDYKTRLGMSLAEIKGETKNSDGGYFRQLVFYKALLDADWKFRRSSREYSLVFVSPDKKGRCPTITLPVTEEDSKKLEGEVDSLIDAVWSEEITQMKCGKHDCEYCALRNILKI
ncbi:MAG: ATP-dependent helicase [Minisyncoccota bacterium]